MRSLRQYRRDVAVRLAPLPASVRAALLAAGCQTYADVLACESAPAEAIEWARGRALDERVRRASEEIRGLARRS